MSDNKSRALRVLLLSDERPGHYHLSEGVVAALERVRPVELHRQTVRRRKFLPMRFLRFFFRTGLWSTKTLLRRGYGLKARQLPQVDLVLSAGGETIMANILAARLLKAENIFCGSLRKVAPENFSLVLTSYERFADLARHIVCLKPNKIDPDALGRPAQIPHFDRAHPPQRIGFLVGGNSGLFSYRKEEWERVIDFMTHISREWGVRWLVSTSRRTESWVGDQFAKLALNKNVIEQFIDYRRAGPGTLSDIFAYSDMILCTEDSSTMISEAICARLPVVGIAPEKHDFKPEEREYRAFMEHNNWCRFVLIMGLSEDRFAKALSEITPLQENHLDKLADSLKQALPGLFEG